MLWFKHLVNSTSDPDLMESETRFRANGPYVFWRTVEILAREDALKGPLVMDFATFARWYPSVSKPTLRKILEFFNEVRRKKDGFPRITSSFLGDTVSIFCDKLADLSSNYTKKVRTKDGHSTDNVCPIEVDREVDGEKEVREGGTPAPKSSRFQAPDVEQVTEYCKERRNGIDAQRFVDHYTSNGWRVGGKAPMKDWKAAIRTWEKREGEFGNRSGNGQTPAARKEAKRCEHTERDIDGGVLRCNREHGHMGLHSMYSVRETGRLNMPGNATIRQGGYASHIGETIKKLGV